ncbi:unnamed protein product, partial [Mesorhabditis spiculigera]
MVIITELLSEADAVAVPAYCKSGPSFNGICPETDCDGGDGFCYCMDCDAACQACKSLCTTKGPTTTAYITTIAPTTAGNCIDNNKNCAVWVKSGFCENNQYTWQQRKDYCAKSCGLCNCVDTTKDCADWIKNGFCTNPKYTDEEKRKYCALSCGLCNAPTGATTLLTTPGVCKDNSPNCPDWVKNGFCTNPQYDDEQKRKFCAKSCNLC